MLTWKIVDEIVEMDECDFDRIMLYLDRASWFEPDIGGES